MLRNKLFVTMLMLAGEGGYVGLPQSMYDDGLAAIAKYKYVNIPPLLSKKSTKIRCSFCIIIFSEKEQ